MIRIFFLLLVATLASCAPNDSSNSSADYINTNAAFLHNVSDVYAVTASSSTPLPFELKWRDSTGLVHKLSDYKGKPVFIAIGRTNDGSSDTLFREVDSMQIEMKDTLMTLIVAHDATGMATVSSFVTSNNIRSQVIS